MTPHSHRIDATTGRACVAHSVASGGRRRIAPLACAIGAAALLASSAAEARTISFYSLGIGRTSCQKYVDASKGLEPDHFRTVLKEQRTFLSENAAYDEWIRGVLSGINYASAESGRHPVVRPTTVELITWVRSWCQSHPDTTVMTAVLSFFQEKYAGSPATTPSPSSSPPSAVAAAPAAPQFVFVIFQKDVAATDMASFLKTYHVAIDDGPNPDGFYKLRLAEPLPPDQLAAMLDSMRGQTKIVGTAVTN